MPEDDDLSLVRKENIELKKQNEALQQAIRKMGEAATGPQKVKWSNESLRVDLNDVSSGKLIIEQEEAEPVKLKDGQISKNDPNLGKYLADVASGKLEVV